MKHEALGLFLVPLLVALIAPAGCTYTCEEARDCGPWTGVPGAGGAGGGDATSVGGGGGDGGSFCGGALLETDPKNCGVCGHDCLGGICTAGMCQPVAIADGLFAVRYVVADGDHVYWGEKGSGGRIGRVTKNGSSGPQTIATNALEPTGLALNGGFIYYCHLAGEQQARVSRAPVEGGGGTTVALLEAQHFPWDVVVAGSTAYISDPLGAIVSVPASGGTFSAITTNEGQPRGIGYADGFLYWADATAGTIRRMPLAGTPETVASNGVQPFNLDVVGDRLIWTDTANEAPGAGKIYFKDGPANAVALAEGLDSPFDIVLDGEVAYASLLTGSILRVHLDGSPHEVLTSGHPGVWGIAQDETAIYYGANSRIYRLAKPPLAPSQ